VTTSQSQIAGSGVAEFQVTGMTCSHCEHAVSTEVGQVAGVQSVVANSATGRLIVTSDGVIDDAQVLAAVDEAGYRATRIR
jgi:copper chaperone